MITIRLLLLILGLLCLLMAAVGVVAPRVNLQALGLSFWLAAVILQ